MEVYFRQLIWHLGNLLMVLLSYAQGQSAADNSNTASNLAFFNATLNSSLAIPASLNFTDNIIFSFRTCSHGQLLWQQGQSGDSLEFSLTPNGALNISWSYSQLNISEFHLLGDENTSFTNNHYYTVDSSFSSDQIDVHIQPSSVRLFETALSNSTYRDYLSRLDLSNGSDIIIGDGFTGCIASSAGLNLSAENRRSTEVSEGVCPLNELTDTCERGCDLAPCQNNATCVNRTTGSRRYECLCPQGVTGVNCETDIDECLSATCQNGGVCQDGLGTYICSCSGTGFSGVQCGDDIDECLGNPCENGGTCRNIPGSFSCTCPQGFSDQNCSTVIWCETERCLNGGTCQHEGSTYTCHCADGYTGSDCNNNINDCVPSPCLNGGTCHDGVSNYTCECRDGYNGTRCEQVYDVCAAAPCQNGGTCREANDSFTCECVHSIINLTSYTGSSSSVYRVGYYGSRCEHMVNVCEEHSEICINNGACRNDSTTQYGFICLCPQQPGAYFQGPYCQHRKDECELRGPDVCKNGGTCHPNGDDFNCDCVPGYSDKTCSTNIDECASMPCLNNATCVDGVNGYTCNCTAGFSGDHCETNVDECASQPCVNGECVDLINSFFCDCDDTGYEGVVCELDIDECLSSPCVNNATCNNLINAYRCDCHEGYNGTNCEVDIDECESSPCANNATCLQLSDQSRQDFSFSTAAGFECDCAPGFEGDLCTVDIDECHSNPCVNGNCSDLVNGYVCDCEPGYEGTHCDIDINECDRYDACQNGAGCRDLIADYSCSCLIDYVGVMYGGKNCSVRLTGCSRGGECENGATCLPLLRDERLQIHSYSCQCPPGFTGDRCEKETTVSFLGSSWLQYDGTEGFASANFMVSFRTSLPDGLILVNTAGTEYFFVQLLEAASLQLRYKNDRDDVDIKLNTNQNKPLNDGEWHSIEITIVYTRIDFLLYHEDCPDVCNKSSVMHNQINSRHHDLGPTSFGANSTDLTQFGIGPFPAFIGCFRDVSVRGETIVPMDYYNGTETDKAENLELGCRRTEQCLPDPCSGNGDCSDRWFSYTCLCRRPFFGTTCGESYIAASFGLGRTESYSKFDIPADTLANELLSDTLMSFLFRTKEYYGLLFYLGSRNIYDAAVTYLAADLYEGQVRVATKFEGDSEDSVVTHGDFVSDGEQYLLKVHRSSSHLTVQLNNNAQVFNVSDGNLTAEVIYFGSLPRSSRRRRDLTNIGHFYGTLQAVELNGMVLQFFEVNTTEDIPPSLTATTNSNVTQGVASDNECDLDPCVHGNCTKNDAGYRDYTCTCELGYRGKNCSLIDYCYIRDGCPDNSTCQSVDDGFECVSIATFDGVSSMISYSSSINASNVNSLITLNLRAREQESLILHVQNETGGMYVTVKMSSETPVIVKYNLGSEGQVSTADTTINDGEYHTITVTFGSNEVDLDVDAVNKNTTYSTQSVTLPEMLQGQPRVYVGSVPESNIHSSADDMGHFKGCMSEARISGVLLPFLHHSTIDNSTASQQFHAESVVDITNGCHGDPVCDDNDCENNATCQDDWNKYSCRCVPGFDGDFCENNIDECEKHDPCDNGATCEDGINDYTCVCAPGYTDKNCSTEIDECESNPCLNNGTCHDDIARYNCSCMEDYFGISCEYFINDTCDIITCHNGGTCVPVNVTDLYEPDYIENFNCSCVPGYRGRFCESEIDYCENDPCVNGTCYSSIADLDYNCTCYQGFGGKDCNISCEPGYTGYNCTDDIDECEEENVCKNGGICVNTPGSFYCNCSGTGYEGPQCETDIDECKEPICQNGGQCGNLDGSYYCNCTFGYEGEHCETPNCDLGNCYYDGTCTVNEESRWQCECVEFYEGDRCEIEGDCLNITCYNGASCQQDDDGKFLQCDCLAGYEGDYCETETDECESAPCKNGATCNDYIAYFNCSCTQEYLGITCEVYNRCADDDFCQNDGICDWRQNEEEEYEFFCDCLEGYEGSKCEKEPSSVNIGLIIGITLAAIALVILAIVGVAIVCHVRSKRATAGTYSPSRQEMDGSRVHMDQILKPPLEERLI